MTSRREEMKNAHKEIDILFYMYNPFHLVTVSNWQLHIHVNTHALSEDSPTGVYIHGNHGLLYSKRS